MSIFVVKLQAPALGVDGDLVEPSPIIAAVERLGDEIQRFDQLFATVMERLQEAEQRQFAGEGTGPLAGHWAELSEQYAEYKRRQHGDQPILVASGTLREALTTTTGNALRAISATEMSFGTFEIPYASYHQEGTERMPARPPIDLDDTFQKEFSQAVEDHVRMAHEGSGLDEYSELVMSDVEEATRLDEDLERILSE